MEWVSVGRLSFLLRSPFVNQWARMILCEEHMKVVVLTMCVWRALWEKEIGIASTAASMDWISAWAWFTQKWCQARRQHPGQLGFVHIILPTRRSRIPWVSVIISRYVICTHTVVISASLKTVSWVVPCWFIRWEITNERGGLNSSRWNYQRVCCLLDRTTRRWNFWFSTHVHVAYVF
jgi:hypothetical protein